jgi:hypothetical protein
VKHSDRFPFAISAFFVVKSPFPEKIPHSDTGNQPLTQKNPAWRALLSQCPDFSRLGSLRPAPYFLSDIMRHNATFSDIPCRLCSRWMEPQAAEQIFFPIFVRRKKLSGPKRTYADPGGP